MMPILLRRPHRQGRFLKGVYSDSHARCSRGILYGLTRFGSAWVIRRLQASLRGPGSKSPRSLRCHLSLVRATRPPSTVLPMQVGCERLFFALGSGLHNVGRLGRFASYRVLRSGRLRRKFVGPIRAADLAIDFEEHRCQPLQLNDAAGLGARWLRLRVRNMRVLAICGSLQAKSGNMTLLKTAAALMPPGAELVLFDGLRELPHFNPDVEASGVPESVTQWRQALAASDAVLIASPEYGFSLPGVLKNGIDWVIGSGELEQKVVAITAAVAGPQRGRRGLEALRNTLSAVRATIVGGAEPIAKGPGLESQVAGLVRALLEATAAHHDMTLASTESDPRD